MNTIARGTAINLVTRVLAIGLGLIVVFVTARLGPLDQGAFSLFCAVESVLLMLGSGFGVALARRVSHHNERPAAVVGAVMLCCLALGIVCAVGMVGFATVAGSSQHHYLWVLAFGLPTIFLTPSLAGLWLGHSRMLALARINLAAPLLTIFGLGAALWLRGRVELHDVLWSWIGARVLVALATVFAAARLGWIGRPDLKALGPDVRFIVVIGMTNLIGLLNYKADLFLVEHFLGRASTGVYSVAVMVAELLWLVSSSVTQAAYARIGTPDAADASRLTLRAMHGSVLALAVLAPALWLVASTMLTRVLGPDYEGALPVLACLLPGVLAYGAASALSAYFTNHAGRPLIPAALAGASLLVNLALSVLLIPRFGMLGGALATTVSYLVSIAIAVAVFQRHSGMPLRQLVCPNWPALRADLRRMFALPLRG